MLAVVDLARRKPNEQDYYITIMKLNSNVGAL